MTTTIRIILAAALAIAVVTIAAELAQGAHP